MSEESRTRSQPQTRTRERPRQSERVQEHPDLRTRAGKNVALAEASAKRSPTLQMEEPAVTPGTAGERNVTTEIFWEWVENDRPAGFVVTTRPEHGLEVTLEQLSYRKTYTGTGSIKTGLVPVAPVGTRGRLIARDLTTGEILEFPWKWHSLGGGFSGLWEFIKRLFWKG